MRSAARMLVFATFVLLGLSWTADSSETVSGGVRGAVADDSGGVLPGATVTATATDGRLLATAVTDEAGAYALRALPAGSVRLTFELEGFATDSVAITIHPGDEALVEAHLALAPLSENVTVYGQAPADPPAPPLPPPPPVVIPVPDHDRESICGPAKPGASPASSGTIRSHRFEAERQLYTKNDQLVVDGGTLNGLAVGQNLVVRRYYRTGGARRGAATGEHTSGVVQIVSADERVSTAVVVYACDELMKGDFLAPFKPEPVRTPDPAGIPIYEDAAQVLFADAGQMMGVPRRLMVIDKGSDAGIHVGQRLTLFRRPGPANRQRLRRSAIASATAEAGHCREGEERGARTPSVIGDAVVVSLRTDSATIRVDGATDVIASGDWAAPHRRGSEGLPTAGISNYN
jgi:hypothetical protein